jgi:predicted AAA+ superfamily ATPase
MISIEELVKQNPWWVKGEAALETDPHLQELKKQQFIYHFEAEPKSGINVFRGPRQVGKTTWLKSLIKEHLARTKEPLGVFFYSCDLVQRPAELADILDQYYCQADLNRIKSHAVFLDEVTSILEWGNAIKHLANVRNVKNDLFIITGSSAVDLRKGAERLPGRGIEGRESEFLPLPFGEYLGLVKNTSVPKYSPESFFENGEVKKALLKELSGFFLNVGLLNEGFSHYLKTGGFLKAINSLSEKNTIEETVFETYARWIESDISKAYRNSVFAKQVASALLSTGSSTFSLNSIAKKTSLQTHVSAGEYITLFEDMVLLNVLNKIDRSKKQAAYRKEKKIYFRDPFIIELIRRWTAYNGGIAESAIIEQIVLEHLCRLFGKTRLFFYNDGKREVDAVVLTQKNELLPIEVKWQENLAASDFEGLYSFGRGIMLTKNRFEIHKDRYLLMPVSLFLSLLDIKPFIRVKLV